MTTTTPLLPTALAEFTQEIDDLLAFDAANQRSFSSGISGSIDHKQLEMLTESTFFKAFRTFENFIRDAFMIYCMEEPSLSGLVVKSYLKAQTTEHAEKLIQSSMNYLEWNSPDVVINRAELYLENGFPIKNCYTASRVVLNEMRLIRNHIAHNSSQSLAGYNKVVRQHNSGVLPIHVPVPGTFLLQRYSTKDRRHKLVSYLESMKTLAADISQ